MEMNGYINGVVVLFVFILNVCPVLGYEVCLNYLVTFTYCETGYHCCDNKTRCCADSPLLTVGAIVGIVFGALVFLGFCIAFICYAVTRSKTRPGRVIMPSNNNQVSVVSQSAMYGQGYNNTTPQYPYGQMPTAYMAQPPPYPYGQMQTTYAAPPPYSNHALVSNNHSHVPNNHAQAPSSQAQIPPSDSQFPQ
ncbi:cysteine and tyrosine-rich protein 1-like [Dreissena polymorpha]|uniref:Cysteine and tyrosine-rich protein 1 n=1 Tax=Dreissena polymorpha TaxID=45954 RepID=A0A9D4N0Q0_DREPO|nr:cysteine and tyrosine-rich protein 1-like [Dreissena polymorpha]KAH3885154.1 hypothetical protein DPMN_009144 [Dreissena polymorpha]